MIDNEYDGIVEGVEAPRATPARKSADFARATDLLNPHRPLLPGGRSFAAGHKHWLVEFKTSGIVGGAKGKDERLTEIILKEIDPLSRSLEKPDGETFHRFVNPEIACNPEAMRRNGHNNLQLNDMPNFKAIAPLLSDRFRNQIVYVRNKQKFESVVERQLKESGIPELSTLLYDLVDVKEHALKLHLGTTNKIVEIWQALGIDAKADEKRSRVLVESMRMGIARMREKLQAEAVVLPLSITVPKTVDQIVIKAGAKSPVQESLALDFGQPSSPAAPQRNADSIHAPGQKPPTLDANGREIKRRKRNGNAHDVAMREHVVCVRRPTAREMSTGRHNLGHGPILHISSRTGSNIFDPTSPLVLFHETIAAGEGSQRKANAFRDAISDIYELAGYRRYTEEPPKYVSPRKPGATRKARPSEVPTIHEQLAVTLRAVAAVPLDYDAKMLVIEALANRMADTAKVGVIEEASPLWKVLSKVRAYVSGNGTLQDIDSELPAAKPSEERAEVAPLAPEPSAVEPSAPEEPAHVVEASVPAVESDPLPVPVVEEIHVSAGVAPEMQPTTSEHEPVHETALALATRRARLIVANVESEIDNRSGPALTILNTPYATLCARYRDTDDVVQDLVNESVLARAQAEVLLAHAMKKENAARRLAQSSD